MIFEVILIFIGLLMSFSAVLISSFAKPSEKQKFSFLATVSALIYFIISFLNIYSDTVDQFIIYQKFTFTAGIYMMIGFGFALSYMFDITYSNKTKLAIILASLFLVALFTTFSDSSPWVKSIDMVKDESCSLFQFKVNGDWLYYLLNGLTIVALITWITIIVVKTFKEKGREFKIFRYLLCLALIPLFIWIFSVLEILPSLISNEICFMIVLLIVMHVEIFYSIKFDPKKYVEPLFNSTACGIIILDSKKRYIHSNNKAKEFFSILNMDNKDAITAFININIVEEKVYFDGKYNYTINVDTIKDNNNPRIGYAVWVDREEIIEENKEAE